MALGERGKGGVGGGLRLFDNNYFKMFTFLGSNDFSVGSNLAWVANRRSFPTSSTLPPPQPLSPSSFSPPPAQVLIQCLFRSAQPAPAV